MDAETVTAAKKLELSIIQSWIKEYNSKIDDNDLYDINLIQ